MERIPGQSSRVIVSALSAVLFLSGGVARADTPVVHCAGGLPLRLPNGTWACASEPETPPDAAVAVDAAGAVQPERAVLDPVNDALGTVTCVDDGTSGPRVQAMYVVAQDRTDRSDSIVPLIQQWATQIDDIYRKSSPASPRSVRWVHDEDCRPLISTVVIPSDADDTFSATIQAVAAAGYDQSDRRYLMWVESDRYCGIAVNFPDDRPDDSNPNNGPWPLWGRIDTPCWGNGGMVEAHELTHMLGAVQASAPHASPFGHCTDEYDLMCYVDGQGVSMSVDCPDRQGEFRLDCGNDDYFDPSPATGTYLDTHWNVARSAFLITTGAGAPQAVTAGYADVRRDDPFSSDIEWLAAEHITRGCNPPINDRFCPDDPVTRGQMAAFLVRAFHVGSTTDSRFGDVGDSQFADDVSRLAGAGITRGCTDQLFCPNQVVTRGQMAAFLVRALALPAGAPQGFSDTEGSAFGAEIDALGAAGITTGCSPHEFCPNEPVTRAQMAAFLRRAFRD